MRILLGLLLTCAAAAQTAVPSFEVASVKPAARPSPVGLGAVRGGPGSSDPGQIRIIGISLRNLILRAYGIEEYQLAAPGWIESEQYDVVAKVPAGATRAESLLMMQALLADRFHLTVHREQREVSGYAMVVAKGGAKFQESAATADMPAGLVTGPARYDQDGYPIARPGFSGMQIDSALYGGAHVARGTRATMQDFAAAVALQLGRAVEDRTGLPGKYDFRLHWVSERVPPPGSVEAPSTPDGPDLATAMQSQLGLKLETKKISAEILVVDHVERVPTEN
jgi:uncharacterized protein (TIGR03435 family)